MSRPALLAALLALHGFLACGAHAAQLQRVEDFGPNPANIDMYAYVPEGLVSKAPLVVSLHGCRQNAQLYANAGWPQLADERRFYVIYPEQTARNHALRCWNWFMASETERGEGELRSIIEMIRYMQDKYAIDDQRIYVEGLSAGGFMTAILLAAHPEIFAGGAINAGGPSYCAHIKKRFWDPFGFWYTYISMARAKKCMRGIDRKPEAWAKLARQLGNGDHAGAWPIVSIWQGDEDATVEAMNQREIVEQWTHLHGIDQDADRTVITGLAGNIVHEEYHDASGRVRVETWTVPGMGHGTPIQTGMGANCGTLHDYILDAGICAVRRIAHFWGLDD